MALPYITPNQLKSMAEKAKSNGGEAPTKTSQLENDSGFMTLTEADSKYAPKGDYATQEQVGEAVSSAKGEIEGTLGEYAKESQIPVAGKDYFGLTDISDGEHPDRHSMMMKNDDSVSGYATDGDSYNLAMVSKWDVADFGSRGLPINLNGSGDRPTYNDDKEIAFVDDLERMPLICTMPFRKVSGYLGDDGKKFSKETVLGWFGVTTIDELKQLVVKKPIYLMYGITLTGKPMHYYIPCQYVAFTANNKLELITDGLDTNNDKLSRYKIVLTFVLESEATVEDTEIAITVDDYIHLPELPEDASSKTYVLKAVNGKIQWVEG